MSRIATLVENAKTELATWKRDGLVECVRSDVTGKPLGDPLNQPGSRLVAGYWSEGLGDPSRNGCSQVAWSAAFICWCLRRSGVKLDEFPFSAGHHSYIRWAIANSTRGKPDKLYYGMRLGEYRPQPGDMIAAWRKARKSDPDPNISFDNQPDAFYPAHCDIVVEPAEDRVIAIGGNLSERVKEARYPATGGLLVPQKQLICVLRHADNPN